jgi:hypothetical protein
MTRYRIREEQSGVSIDLTEVSGRQDELLNAFEDCASGQCSCPTDQFEKLASMDVHRNEDQIALRLESRYGTRFDPSAIAACLDHTVDRIPTVADDATQIHEPSSSEVDGRHP